MLLLNVENFHNFHIFLWHVAGGGACNTKRCYLRPNEMRDANAQNQVEWWRHRDGVWGQLERDCCIELFCLLACQRRVRWWSWPDKIHVGRTAHTRPYEFIQRRECCNGILWYRSVHQRTTAVYRLTNSPAVYAQRTHYKTWLFHWIWVYEREIVIRWYLLLPNKLEKENERAQNKNKKKILWKWDKLMLLNFMQYTRRQTMWCEWKPELAYSLSAVCVRLCIHAKMDGFFECTTPIHSPRSDSNIYIYMFIWYIQLTHHTLNFLRFSSLVQLKCNVFDKIKSTAMQQIAFSNIHDVESSVDR